MEELYMDDGFSQGGDEDRGGVAPAAPQEPGPAKAGHSVTPGLQISGPSKWEFLAANVDTLDLSLYVDWGQKWADLFEELEKGKLSAQETGVAIFRGGETIIFSTAGKRFFSWHFQRTEFHLFLARNPEHVPASNVLPRAIGERRPDMVNRFVVGQYGCFRLKDISPGDLGKPVGQHLFELC